MAAPPKKPAGNDPRLALGNDELESASRAAFPRVGNSASKIDLGLIAIIVAALGIGAVTWITITAPKPAAAPQAKAASTAHSPAAVAPSAAPASPTLGAPVPPPSMAATHMAPVAPDTRTPVMIVDNSAAPASANADKAAPAQSSAPLLDANEQFSARLTANTSNSSHIADRALTIPQGAIIPAVLETALNSDLPGYARAIVSRDVQGFDGTKVLVPRGSRLVGQYRSGLSSGVTRAFVIWERLIRPDGISVQLGSPAVDEIGQAGLAGDVDSHFLKRFGSAMLLSVVSGLSSSNSSTAIVIGSSPQNVASDALGSDAKIPPTIKIAQGTVIQVFVARDLNFGE